MKERKDGTGGKGKVVSALDFFIIHHSKMDGKGKVVSALERFSLKSKSIGLAVFWFVRIAFLAVND